MSTLLILLFPLMGFLYSLCLNLYLGRQISIVITCGALLISAVLSVLGLYEIMCTSEVSRIVLIDWVVSNDFSINWGVKFDQQALIMCVVITVISANVHIYAMDYMRKDPRSQVFSSYLSLFTLFMLILVCADNLVFLYVGWEGVGLASFLLIGYWNTRYSAVKAAVKAMVTNRVSDIFFLMGILLIMHLYGSANFDIISLTHLHIQQQSVVTAYHNWTLLIACISIFIGAVGKSAQIFMHVWLPDAMEGPTPVSALLHAATMVTAGVVLLIKLSWLFVSFPGLSTCIAIIGSLTGVMASCASVFQFDIKKVIAYSTCSQLGYMVMACGLNYYNVALFHLFNHAFFKALLFLGAGSIIHAVADEQDMRRMGGLANFLPFTMLCIIVGSLAIMGIPFLAGFYSKDVILELAVSSYIIDGVFLYFMALFAAFCTSVYSIRMLVFVFFFNPKGSHTVSPVEADHYMTVVLATLLVFSCIVGYMFCDYFLGFGTPALSDSVAYLPLSYFYSNTLLVGPWIKNLPLIVSIGGWILGLWLMYSLRFNTNNAYLRYLLLNLNYVLITALYNPLFFNTLYNNIFIGMYKYSYYIHTKTLDKGLWEYLGPVGIYRLLNSMSYQTRAMGNSLTLGLGLMFFGIIFIYIYLIFSVYTIPYYVFNVGIWVCLLIIMYHEFVNQNNKN